ncbi:MAG: hypothetical protein KBC26_01705 [Candidatus Pacebacteria bacterium]|nr:hypothetical protein [Candidatus Paceibacterota bacterium]
MFSVFEFPVRRRPPQDWQKFIFPRPLFLFANFCGEIQIAEVLRKSFSSPENSFSQNLVRKRIGTRIPPVSPKGETRPSRPPPYHIKRIQTGANKKA